MEMLASPALFELQMTLGAERFSPLTGDSRQRHRRCRVPPVPLSALWTPEPIEIRRHH
jgi:hypothetical protein